MAKCVKWNGFAVICVSGVFYFCYKEQDDGTPNELRLDTYLFTPGIKDIYEMVLETAGDYYIVLDNLSRFNKSKMCLKILIS